MMSLVNVISVTPLVEDVLDQTIMTVLLVTNQDTCNKEDIVLIHVPYKDTIQMTNIENVELVMHLVKNVSVPLMEIVLSVIVVLGY